MKTTTKLLVTTSTILCLSVSGFAADLTVDGSLKVGDGWASGTNSVAIGHTAANGANSLACGTYTTAGGDYSVAIGGGSTSAGIASAAIGGGAQALGDYSVALGSLVIANHNNSFIWSDGNTAGWGGHAETTSENQFNVFASNGIRLETGPNADVTINGESVARLSDISNIVQVWSSTVSTQNHGYVWQDVPGLSVTIDPLSANSDILLKANIACSITSGNTRLRIVRSDGTALGSGRGLASITFLPKPDDYNRSQAVGTPMMFLDSPATDAPITYKVQVVASFGAAMFNEWIDSVFIAEEKVK